MTKFCVNYSVNKNYDVEIDAETEEEARDLVDSGNFNEDDADPVGEECIGVNNVERIIND